jgi:hypothetical protein
MNRQMLFLMALAVVMFIVAGVILNRQLRRDAVLTARVRGVQRAVGIEAVVAPTDASQSGVLRLVAGVGDAITRGGLLSASTLEDLELRLSTAGIRGRSALTAFIGAKLLALVGLPLLTWIVVAGWKSMVEFLADHGWAKVLDSSMIYPYFAATDGRPRVTKDGTQVGGRTGGTING